MAFSDIGENDYGTWHRAIAPEVGDPVTVYWMSAVAENIARLTKPLAFQKVQSFEEVEELAFNLATMPCERLPFAKCWIQEATGWTDRYSAGDGNSMNAYGSVLTHDIWFISPGSASATLATLCDGGLLDIFSGPAQSLVSHYTFWGR
jgi:hypothetical protein